jgi:hypothetical protein
VECEYLKEENCIAILNSDEGKAIRHEGCENNNKNACCYVCPLYNTCEISCTYLGEKRCPLCGSEMYHVSMNLRIGGWEGVTKGLPFGIGELGELSEEKFPVIAYICSKCNKLEFFAEEKAKKKYRYWLKKGKSK